MYSILVGKKVVAQTPHRFGVNVEVQDHYERCNLWDWLVDSGSTVLRECHPWAYFRRTPMDPKLLVGIKNKAGFEQWRKGLAAHPETLAWDMYMFNESLKWLGVPDGIIGKVKAGRMEPIISMDYYPRMFPQSLVRYLDSGDLSPHAASYGEMKDPSPLVPGVWERMPTDDEINWQAAAAAYEYYFACLYHFTGTHRVRYFNLHNEPEFYYRYFYFPAELMPDPPKFYQKYGAFNTSSYMVPMVMQMAVLSKIARWACDDVKAGLNNPQTARDLTLASPAWAGPSEYFWSLAHPYVDISDYHVYTTDCPAFENCHRRVSLTVGQTAGKKTACTEYGRKGGPIRVSDLLFDIGPALEAAALMMTTLEFTKPGDPPCEFVAFYHFQFPATHRNFKNLVYGDMNTLDWTGQDKPLNGRGEKRYPTFEELQLRYPTAAYHMFRMLARCAPAHNATVESYPVMETGAFDTRHPSVKVQVIDAGRDLVVNLLNPTQQKVTNVELDLGRFADHIRFAVVREASRTKFDEVVAQLSVVGGRVIVDLAAQSLTQVILTPLALDKVSSLRLEEKTLTPGNAQDGLAQFQTTRFQAWGSIAGQEVDLSQLNIVWSSSDAEVLPVYQGGLVVCLKSWPGVVTIHAMTLDKSVASDVAVTVV